MTGADDRSEGSGASGPGTGARETSIAGRLALMLGVVSLVVFVLAGALLDWALTAQLESQEVAEASGRLSMARHFIHTRVSGGESLKHELDDLLESHPELRLWVFGPDGAVLYGGAPPRVEPASGTLLRVEAGDGVFKGLRETLPPGNAMAGASLLIGLDTRERERLMIEHRVTLLVVTILGTALIVALTAWVARRELAPIAALSREAGRISPDALGVRLPVAGTPEELRQLAHAFNRVLDRLERAYRQLDAFNANVAHELRTPLATLINGTQVTLGAERGAGELREALASNLEELEGLTRLVNDMLFLARADRGEVPERIAPVALEREALAVAEYFEAVAQERALRIVIEGRATASGDAALLRRAISNLVSNAVRHADPATDVRIRIREDVGRPVISVVNRGSPIPHEDMALVFDRFFQRGGAVRHDGHGLGLSIVRAIARMHGGDAFATSDDGEIEVGFRIGRPSVSA